MFKEEFNDVNLLSRNIYLFIEANKIRIEKFLNRSQEEEKKEEKEYILKFIIMLKKGNRYRD